MDAALNPKEPRTIKTRCAAAFESEALRIFIGVLIGGAVGVLVAALCPEDRCAGVGPSEACAATAELLGFIGSLWMQALKCVVLPLICCNVTLSSAELKKQAGAGKIGRWLVGYYLLTTCLAALEGLAVTLSLIHI